MHACVHVAWIAPPPRAQTPSHHHRPAHAAASLRCRFCCCRLLTQHDQALAHRGATQCWPTSSCSSARRRPLRAPAWPTCATACSCCAPTCCCCGRWARQACGCSWPHPPRLWSAHAVLLAASPYCARLCGRQALQLPTWQARRCCRSCARWVLWCTLWCWRVAALFLPPSVCSYTHIHTQTTLIHTQHSYTHNQHSHTPTHPCLLLHHAAGAVCPRCW